MAGCVGPGACEVFLAYPLDAVKEFLGNDGFVLPREAFTFVGNLPQIEGVAQYPQNRGEAPGITPVSTVPALSPWPYPW